MLVPALSGCITYGATIEEALRNGEEAISCHVLALKDLGKTLPREGSNVTLPAEELTGTIYSAQAVADRIVVTSR